MLKMSNIMLGSEDAKSLSNFYSTIFGPPDSSDDSFIGWQLGGVGLSIGPHSEVKGRNESPGRILLNLETADFQQEFDRIKALGVTVVQEPYRPGGEDMDFWMATFEDPDGNYFQIASPMVEM